MASLISQPSDLIDSDVLRAWAPPPRLDPATWAEENIEVIDGPRQGRLDHRNAPYLRDLMKIANARGVEQLNIVKAAQIGVSAMFRWLMCYWSVCDPDPIGLTMPDKIKGESIVANRIIPLFNNTSAVRDLMTGRAHDIAQRQIRLLNGFILHLMWSHSPAAMASDPMRRVGNDEVDKMPAWSGKEGHAVHLTKKRLRTYGQRSIQVNMSTPTTRLGMIWRLFEQSDFQLYYLIPCPVCETRIRLDWPQVKFGHFKERDNAGWASRVLKEHAAWYICQHCSQRMNELERKQAVQQGVWGTCDENGIADGEIVDAAAIEVWSPGTTIGVQISALYLMWETLARIAAEFIRALGDLSAMYDFRTQTIGMPFEEQVTRVDSDIFSERSIGQPEGVLPPWAACAIATIDTQADHFWLVIRAWGPGMRSQRVFHSRVESFEELERLCFEVGWRFESDDLPALTCDIALIDSGGTRREGDRASRTMEVYSWALRWSSRVRAIKGDNKPQPGRFYRRGKGWYDEGEGRQKVEVPLWILDTHHYQDELNELLHRNIKTVADDGSVAEGPAWLLNANNDGEYNSHMSNITKVALREKSDLVHAWVPVTPGARIDYRDCEGYQIAAAYMHQVHLLPSLEDFMAMRRAEVARRNTIVEAQPNGVRMPDGRAWIASQR